MVLTESEFFDRLFVAYEQGKGFFECSPLKPPPYDPEKISSDHDYFAFLGFEKAEESWPTTLGETSAFSGETQDYFYARTWAAKEGASHGWKFLVEVGDIFGARWILVGSLPSLIALHIQLAPVLTAQMTGATLDTIHVIEKWFEAEHGHWAHGICRKCAPQEFEAQQRRRAEALAKKTKEK